MRSRNVTHFFWARRRSVSSRVKKKIKIKYKIRSRGGRCVFTINTFSSRALSDFIPMLVHHLESVSTSPKKSVRQIFFHTGPISDKYFYDTKHYHNTCSTSTSPHSYIHQLFTVCVLLRSCVNTYTQTTIEGRNETHVYIHSRSTVRNSA